MRTLFVILIVCFASAAVADDLPRRSFLGVALGPTEEQRGVAIINVIPESAAFYAGIEAGSVLQKVGSVQLLGPGAVEHAMKALAAQKAGEAVLLTVTKDTYTSHMTVELPEFPRESNPNFETIYDAVDVDGTLHRAIVTKPTGDGPFATVFYIQGLSCSSVEAPMDPEDPIRLLLNGLTEAGYATFRIEKRGVGDSEGEPCGELDFADERAGYLRGLQHLKRLPYVDGNRVFLFGHSMGGVFAPVIAADEPVAGIVAYGTIGAPLAEYFEVNDARQMKLRGLGETNVEKSLELVRDFNERFLTGRKSPGEVFEAEPKLKPFVITRAGDELHLFGRHYTFWHQLDDQNLPEPWRKVNVPVLAVWGQSDVPATREDHAAIAEIVNASHPGSATFLEIPGIGHGFESSATMEESMRNNMQAPFNTAVVTETVEWLNAR